MLKNHAFYIISFNKTKFFSFFFLFSFFLFFSGLVSLDKHYYKFSLTNTINFLFFSFFYVIWGKHAPSELQFQSHVFEIQGDKMLIQNIERRNEGKEMVTQNANPKDKQQSTMRIVFKFVSQLWLSTLFSLCLI
jgi:hypothetical protein